MSKHRAMDAPPDPIDSIPRGADLTDDDLMLMVNDMYEVRNWAMLQMRMGPEGIKQECFKALQVRLGRREQIR